ncbi:MAG: hypothetical protein ACK46Q_05350 [Hyphomonas sp.]
MKIVPVLLLMLLVSACGSLSSDRSRTPDPVEAAPERIATELPETQPISLPFRLDIALSPDLADALDAAGQQLAVHTTVWGLPRDPAAQSGSMVVLSEDRQRLDVRNQSMILEGRYDKVQAARETADSPRVLITVINTPLEPDGPLMDCLAFEAPLFITVETGAQVDCNLASD